MTPIAPGHKQFIQKNEKRKELSMSEEKSKQQDDDFERGWQETFARFRLPFAMTTALLKLTGMGERPVAVEHLAQAIGRSPQETVALALQWARVRIADGFITYDPEGSPFSRYRVEVGTCVLNVGGCAPDLFWAVLAAGLSIRAESTCPATGTAIQVDLSSEGVQRVEPLGAVVTMLNPRASVLEEMDNGEDADATVCAQQSFFASAEVAAGWLASHPGGRIFPVAAFFQWFQKALAAVDDTA
jgi:alkylmercury lyase